MKAKITHQKLYNCMLAVLLLIPLAGVQAQATHNVNVTSNEFSPSVITISLGDEVIWTNSEGFHNVNGTTGTFPDNPESFGNSTGTGWMYSYTFTTPGIYDYQCDPHVSLGMTGQVIVEAPDYGLTINFTGMDPHIGQDIWLRVEDAVSGEEIYRGSEVVEASFSTIIPGIKTGGNYIVDMYADHNENGRYDAPGDDHAWRLEVNDVNGNETIDFVHNTNFSDIEWEHAATVRLSGMNPHVGQEIYFALIESSTGKVIDRVSEMVSESFNIVLEELESGKDYHIDFFADHNGNGYYDAPADDHAWRIDLAGANGDEIIDFSHNTNFTDIEWKHRLRVRFEGMNPHVGQMLKLYVRDQEAGTIVDSVTIDEIDGADFDVESHILDVGGSYHVDFYADLNGNGSYDAPPTDHAWRLVVDDAMGDIDLDFMHNTVFTDIMETGATYSVPAFADMELEVYPNPSYGLINFESKSTIRSADILSISGAVVKSYHDLNSRQGTISLDDLSEGVYFLKVRFDNAAEGVERIMKL